MATIQSDLGAERSNWEVLREEVEGDGFLVVANRMNPRNGDAVQTRERLYQVWYNHANAKRHDKNVIEDHKVEGAAVDCDHHMGYLNNNMGLMLKLHHFILPNNDSRVTQESGRLSAELAAKAKKADKQAAKGGAQKRRKIDEDAEGEEEGTAESKKQPKWYDGHSQVWDSMFAEHPELSHISWSPQAAETIPDRYQGNPFFEHMAIRNRDILRMLDLKVPPEQLRAEVVVDLYPMRVLCFSTQQHLSCSNVVVM